MTDQERIDAAIVRRGKAYGAIAAGVALSPGTSLDDGLGAVSFRLGIEGLSARIDALILLTLSKGSAFTEADYAEAVADELERRQQAYESGLQVKLDATGMAPIAMAAVAAADAAQTP